MDNNERRLQLARMLLLRWDELPRGHRIELGQHICRQDGSAELRERLAPMLVNDLIAAILDEPDVRAKLGLAFEAQLWAVYSRSVDLVNSANEWVVRLVEEKSTQDFSAVVGAKERIIMRYFSALKSVRQLSYLALAMLGVWFLFLFIIENPYRDAMYTILDNESSLGVAEYREIEKEAQIVESELRSIGFELRSIRDDLRKIGNFDVIPAIYSDKDSEIEFTLETAMAEPRPPIAPGGKWYISVKDIKLARQYNATQRERLTHLRAETDLHG